MLTGNTNVNCLGLFFYLKAILFKCSNSNFKFALCNSTTKQSRAFPNTKRNLYCPYYFYKICEIFSSNQILQSQFVFRKNLRKKKIWPRRDLNTQPSDLESDALPIAPRSLTFFRKKLLIRFSFFMIFKAKVIWISFKILDSKVFFL